jgi:hypothetical protein
MPAASATALSGQLESKNTTLHSLPAHTLAEYLSCVSLDQPSLCPSPLHPNAIWASVKARQLIEMWHLSRWDLPLERAERVVKPPLGTIMFVAVQPRSGDSQ